MTARFHDLYNSNVKPPFKYTISLDSIDYVEHARDAKIATVHTVGGRSFIIDEKSVMILAAAFDAANDENESIPYTPVTDSPRLPGRDGSVVFKLGEPQPAFTDSHSQLPPWNG